MEDERVDNEIGEAIAHNRLSALARLIRNVDVRDIAQRIERMPRRSAAVVFRLLPKDRALEVFEKLGTGTRSELLLGLRDAEVGRLFAELPPDDRVTLMDELPATVAKRLLSGLDEHERELTTIVLGYPPRSVGRRMSPEYTRALPEWTVAQALERVRADVDRVDTIYAIPVTDSERRLVGIVSLRELFASEARQIVGEVMKPAISVSANQGAEDAARLCSDHDLLALPVVDSETRLIGILAGDDAHMILREAEAEDVARAGASEPLRRSYLSTSILRIARSRVVWLLVLAVSALLTVQVLEVFEATLGQMVALALFIPLLTGTGGNTGSQAATTITRALAVGDVRTRDIGKVMLREVRVGLLLGLLLGALGFVLASLVYDMSLGIVIGTTLLCICAMAATVGGSMPLIAKMIRVDPAVFSTPFITTFCDATGLLIYFSIAKAVLGI